MDRNEIRFIRYEVGQIARFRKYSDKTTVYINASDF
jgi:hypothetical protein